MSHGHEGSIGPGEVVGREGETGVAVEFFGQRAVARRVLLGDCDEGVGIRGDGIHDLGEWAVRVAAAVRTDCDAGEEVLEEGKRSGVYAEVPTGLPLGDSVVEEFCCGRCDQVPRTLARCSIALAVHLPWISSIIDILWISSNCDPFILWNSRVNGVQVSEAIHQNFEVRK